VMRKWCHAPYLVIRAEMTKHHRKFVWDSPLPVCCHLTQLWYNDQFR
jgi:hypothetical protein